MAAMQLNFIANASVPSASGRTIAVIDPSDGQPFDEIQRSNADDIDAAVHAARQCYHAVWQKLAPVERGGQTRLACTQCDFVHWRNPVPVVAAVVERAGRVVLVHSIGRPPTWYGLVAGFLERGEHPEAAVLREVAEELGLEEVRAHALTTVGMAKNAVGDTSGIEDMERALEIALAVDSPIAGTIVNNLAVEAFSVGDMGRAEELYAESMQISERLGDREVAGHLGALVPGDRSPQSRW